MALTGQQTLHGSTCRQIRNKTSVLQAKICSGVKFYIDNLSGYVMSSYQSQQIMVYKIYLRTADPKKSKSCNKSISWFYQLI